MVIQEAKFSLVIVLVKNVIRGSEIWEFKESKKSKCLIKIYFYNTQQKPIHDKMILLKKIIED